MDVSGPSACFINVSVNNATPKLYKRFDQWSTYYRINYFLIDEINKEGEYSVTIKVSDEKFDKKAVLLENQDNKGIELNEEYKKYDYYTSYVMLIGSLIK